MVSRSGFVQATLVAAIYFASARFGLSLALVNESATAVWPPSGLALAAVLLLGHRIWPGILAGAVLANLVNLLGSDNLNAVSTPTIALIALAIGVGNTLEATVGGWLIRRLAGGQSAFDRAPDIVRYVVCGPILATAISATIGVTSRLSIGPPDGWASYPAIWSTWWLGDMAGMLIVTPLLVIWHRWRLLLPRGRRLIESAGLGLLVILVGGLVFGGWLPSPVNTYPLGFFCVPPLVWAAFRFHQPGAVTAVFCFSCIALWGTLHGFGPYAGRDPNSALIMLQGFMGTTTVTMLILAALAAQQKREELALSSAEERYRSLVLASAQVVWCSTAVGDVVEDLPTWRAFTGQSFEQMRGRGWMAALHPDDVAATARVWEHSLATGTPHEQEFRVRRTDGEYRVVLARAMPVRGVDGTVREWVGTCTDITEARSADQELLRHRLHLEQLVRERTRELEASHQRMRLSERMAAMGTLSAGIGHDMGNLLLPMKIHLEALESMKLSANAHEHTTAMGKCISYLQSLTRRLRLFAQDPEQTIASGGHTELTAWSEDVGSFFAKLLPRSITFTMEIPSGLPRIAFAPHMLSQAVLNLINNAKDAIGTSRPGRVRLVAQMARGGETIRITVEDDGPGMEPEVRTRALEPFFSTKSRSLSTGLGLTLVHGLTQASGGRVEIDSPLADGHGTAVSLIVPIWRAEPPPPARHREDARAVERDLKPSALPVVEIPARKTAAPRKGVFGHSE